MKEPSVSRARGGRRRGLSRGSRAVEIAVKLSAHAVACGVCASGLLALGLGSRATHVALEAWQVGGALRQQLALELLALGALSAIIWAALYWGAAAMFRRRAPARRATRLVRGTVLTETLIVIPVYLVTMLGTLQLSQSLIAGLLTTLSAFEAGRTAAVWMPEARVGRNGVDEDVARDKIRLAAAAVIAPAAPGSFNANCDDISQSDSLEHLVAGLKGAGHLDDAVMLVQLSQGNGGNLAVWRGFDSLHTLFRGVPKLRAAYCATSLDDVSYTTEDDVEMVNVTISYKHMATMPVVAPIFGEPDSVGSRRGYFSTMTRTYHMPIQTEPNPTEP